ncbi:MAG: NAD-dependent epimerase/dehydratase family protein [Gemmatimonadota bacterium]|nr:NAD-dependent epimerase/dehydratase family protein [Gemmatimonadota bacterium]
MIAVVTGASGFIGANLVSALVADGVEVRLVRRGGVAVAPPPPRTTAYTLDLGAADAVQSPVWRGATHVFHLAARTRAVHPDAFVTDNVRPTAALCALLAQLPSTPRLVFVSSQAAAGPAPSSTHPLTDADVARPVEAYGRSKHDAEEAVRAHRAAFPAVILRPSSVYGPRDRDFLQVFQQLRRAVALAAVPAWHQLSLAHVHDVVAALRLTATHADAVGRSFFVEDGAPTTWGAVYDEIGAVLGRSPFRLRVPRAALMAAAAASEVIARVRGTDPLLTRAKLTLSDHPYWLCDASGLRESLGWRPTIARSDGWALTYDWYREAQWIRS